MDPGKDSHAVAVVGLACRFPGEATNEDGFWRMLCAGRSAYSAVPPDRFNMDAFAGGPGPALNKSRTSGGHFLSQDIRRWDPNFFGITADEAAAMDPQQRLMMEVAYEAFENAGVPPRGLSGSDTGCWMGVNSNDWRETLFRDAEAAPLHTWTGTGPEYISGRVSWFFNLRGPSMTVNTACSSSLVALHEARNAILAGDCGMAVVGGANLIFNPEYYLYYSNQKFLSPDGKCKSFDARGDGFGRGEGLGAVVLKPLWRAIKDKDVIRAVVRGSGVGQDGWTNGITLPNAEAQADLVRATYAAAGLPTTDTGFIEAHGTGTSAGDPAELEAIAEAMGTRQEAQGATKELLVGSVKSNIGHLEAASGIAGLIKAILMVERAQIPPTVGIQELNPRIDWEALRMRVVEKLRPWQSGPGPRRVGVSSFGASGTIAHAIIDDADAYNELAHAQSPARSGRQLQNDVGCHAHRRLVVISASDKAGIKRQASVLIRWLREKEQQAEPVSLGDVAYTLGAKRAAMRYRSFAVVSSTRDLIGAYEHAGTEPEPAPPVHKSLTGGTLRIGMVFTGQGAQWARMGAQLLAYTTFGESVDRADRFLREELGCKWSARAELEATADTSRINSAEFSQPLCTVLQVALVDLLESWGIRPAAVTGHSSGEIAAAYALGSLSDEDAWAAAYWRGNLDKRASLPRGAMMAAGLSQKEAAELLAKVPRSTGVVVVGCVNSPSSVTLSGDEAAVLEAGRLLTEAGVFNRRLKVDTAYHSPHLGRISDEYFMRIRKISALPSRPGCLMFSSVTGRRVASYTDLGPAYWVRNLVSPVLFAQSIEATLQSGAVDVLFEVGPHAALAAPCQGTMSACGTTLPYLSVLSRGRDAVETALIAVGELWARGLDAVDLASANAAADAQRGSMIKQLPSYAWNHERSYWHESRLGAEYRNREHPHYRFIGAPLPSLVAGEHMWRAFIRPAEEHWVLDHKIHGSVVYPAVGYVAMTVEAARQLAVKDGAARGRKIRAFHLRDVEMLAATELADDKTPVEMVICARPAASSTSSLTGAATADWFQFIISTCADGKMLRKSCTGYVSVSYDPPSPDCAAARELDVSLREIQGRFFEARDSCRRSVDPKAFYAELANIGLEFGPSFQNMSAIWMGESQSVCTVDVVNPAGERDTTPRSNSDSTGQGGDIGDRPFIIHPATFDPITQTITAAVGMLARTPIPTAIDELVISADIPRAAGQRLHVFSTIEKTLSRQDLVSEIHALEDATHRPVLSLRGFRAAQVKAQRPGDDNAKDLADAYQTCGFVVWKPHLGLIARDPARLRRYLEGCVAAKSGAKTGHLASSPLDELFRLVVHNSPEVPVLEVLCSPTWEEEGRMTVVSRLEKDNGIPWHNILDHRVALWDEQESELVEVLPNGPEGHEPGNEAESRHALKEGNFGLVLVRSLPPRSAAKVLQVLAKRIIADHRLVCFEYVGDDQGPQAEQALVEAGLEVLLSMGMPCEDDATKITTFVLACAPTEDPPRPSPPPVLLVEAQDPSVAASDLAAALERRLVESEGMTQTGRTTWHQLSQDADSVIQPGTRIVSLVEVSTALLHGSLDTPSFDRLKQIVLSAAAVNAQILWVTAPGNNSPDQHGVAVKGAIDGLARSVMNEDARVDLRVVHLTEGFAVPDAAEQIGLLLGTRVPAEMRDKEFRLDQDHRTLFVSRVVPFNLLSEYVDEKQPRTVAVDHVTLSPLPPPSAGDDNGGDTAASTTRRSVRLEIGELAQLDTLHFVQGVDCNKELNDNEVEVKVLVSGLNFKDIMIALGRVPGTMEGAEGSGVVLRVGKGVTTIKPRDRVVCLAIGMHASVARVDASSCRPIPDGMSFEEAASLPVAHCTAFNAFCRVARPDPDDDDDAAAQTVLVHAAAGGLGQVAIQYAQHLGMEVYATVGSDEKRGLVGRLYGIPDDHILSSRDTSFASAIRRMTRGRGVDMVLNSLADEMQRQSWRCLAPGGVFVEVGKAVLDSVRTAAGNQVGATYSVFDLEHIIRSRPRLAGKLLDGALDMVSRGATRPVSPCRVFPVAEVQDAFRLMQTGRHMGKILLSWSDDCAVPVAPSNPFRDLEATTLRPDATYLLVGGLGGIGRSVATLLAGLGARYLCFVSRSGLKSASASSVVGELEAMGVQARVYSCDAADAAQLKDTLSLCAAEMPPIRGIVQCAMVLRDCTLSNMSAAMWNEALRPKIEASWNLDRMLPDTDGLDFFTMLASFAGYFGNIGQSNYGAGGTFQDALAEARRARGARAVSLDLGIIKDVGVLAETGMTDNLKDWAADFGISERQLRRLLRVAIQDQVAAGGPGGGRAMMLPPQVPTGFASLRAACLAGIPRPHYLDDMRFAVLANDGRLQQQERAGRGARDGLAGGGGHQSPQRRLGAAVAAGDEGAAGGIVTELLLDKVAQCLQSSSGDVDVARSLPSYGINSLVAIEIRNWLFKEVKADMTIFDLISPMPIEALVGKIVASVFRHKQESSDS